MQIQANIFRIYPVTALPTSYCLNAKGQWEQGWGWVATHTHCNALISSEVSLSVSAQPALAAALVISLSFQRNSAQTAPASDPLPGPTASPPWTNRGLGPWPQSAALNICSEFVLQTNQTLSGNVQKNATVWKGERVHVCACWHLKGNKQQIHCWDKDHKTAEAHKRTVL